jgi:broad specificity phosphatase PhoE
MQGGDLDSELTKLGKIQSKKCGEFLQEHFKFKFGKVICSPMKRARHTAKIVVDELDRSNFDHIEYYENLREKKYGQKITGKKMGEVYLLPVIGPKIKELDNKIKNLNIIEKSELKGIMLEDEIMELTDGEKSDHFRKRMNNVINVINIYIKNNSNSNSNLLIVTHSFVIQTLIQMITGNNKIPRDTGKYNNCAITVFNYDNPDKPNLIISQYSKYLDTKKLKY